MHELAPCNYLKLHVGLSPLIETVALKQVATTLCLQVWCRHGCGFHCYDDPEEGHQSTPCSRANLATNTRLVSICL